eukprot:gene3228-4072_t
MTWLDKEQGRRHLESPAASTFWIPYVMPPPPGSRGPPVDEPVLMLPKLNQHRYQENSEKHPAAHFTLFGSKPQKQPKALRIAMVILRHADDVLMATTPVTGTHCVLTALRVLQWTHPRIEGALCVLRHATQEQHTRWW